MCWTIYLKPDWIQKAPMFIQITRITLRQIKNETNSDLTGQGGLPQCCIGSICQNGMCVASVSNFLSYMIKCWAICLKPDWIQKVPIFIQIVKITLRQIKRWTVRC